MQSLMHDLVYAWRNALRTPGTSLLIVVTLALGIGVNSAMFSVVHEVLLAPLPYVDGERLVRLEQNAPEQGRFNFGWSRPTIADLRDQAQVFSELTGYVQLPFTVSGAGEPRQASAGVVGWNFMNMLGVQPALGRSFTAGDDIAGATPVLLLADDFWREYFAADPAVIGTTMMIKEIAYTVVGVLPPLPPWPHDNDIWIPAASDPYRLFSWMDDEAREGSWAYLVLGKLHENTSLETVRSAVAMVTTRLRSSYPDAYPDSYAVSVEPLRENMAGDSELTFWLLTALTLLVALIASANVASLTLARLGARQQELAVREAVGASPARILRQLLTENLLLATLGCALAIIVAYPAMQLLGRLAGEFTPLAGGIGMDASVVGFAIFIMLLLWCLTAAGSLFGGRDINTVLKEGGDKATASAGGARRRQLLLMLQFALAFIVLSSAALMVFSLYRLDAQHGGFEVERVAAASLMIDVDFGELEQESAPYDDGVIPYYRSFSRTLLEEMRGAPGVESVGLLAGVPLLQDTSYLPVVTFNIEGRGFPDPTARPSAPYHAATEGYFETLRIPLLQGRLFAATDDEDSLPVALINESFAKLYFPAGDALGQRIRFDGDSTWRTIVGIVGDLRSAGLDHIEGAAAYYNYWQYPSEVITLYLQSAESPAALRSLFGAIVRSIHPRQSVASVLPLESLRAEWLAPLSLRTTLIALFGLLALVVTLSGVVGVVSYNVGQRVREIGVHMAVGADPAKVTGMFVRQSLKVYACGLVLGLGLTLLAAPLVEPMLYETSAFNSGAYAVVILLLTLIVLLAIYVPARRAGLLSPMEALHAE